MLAEALRAEEEAEGREHARLDRLPLAEQIASGHAWPPLTITDLAPSGPRLLVSVSAGRGVELHEGIGPGDPVWLDVGSLSAAASVREVEGRRAELQVDRDRAGGLREGPATVRRRHDPSTGRRYREALTRAPDSPLARAVLDRGPAELPPGEAELAGLNAAQRRAAHHALHAPDLALVWGPPGTGKTVLLGKVLAALVRRGERPWALADSNAAVDHLALTALGEGLDVVRLGPVSRIGEALAHCRLDARIETSLLGPALSALDRDISRAWGTPEAPRLLRERHALWRQARDTVLQSASVIATTLGTLARIASDLPETRTAVVDEATQATEPAIWVAIPHVERLILAGDPAQLGPVATVPGSPLGRSLLERWVEAGAPAPMLEIQHRMGSALRELVFEVYGPAYTDAPGLVRPPVLDRPALWIDTAGAGGEVRDPVTRSLYEPLEVALVQQIARRLREEGVSPERIGVIAPYAAQVARLRALPELAGIEVATVNAFQGRERDVIVASFVRSNPDGELGFVTDERRLTVALTRARTQLVLVGDATTLGGHPRFARLLEQLDEAGAVRSVWEPPWSDALG